MRVIAALPSAEVKRYQNRILSISGHRSSTPMVPIDLQDMTSYVGLRYDTIRYDTIRDAILTCAQKLT